MPDFQRVVFRRVGIAVAIASMTVAAIAVVAASATAARGIDAAAPCLVRVATDLGPQTDRLALRGKVSCAQARRTLRAFLRDAKSGACGSGRICGIRQPGGWQCAFLSAVESQILHGEGADCHRAGGSFGVYNASRKAIADKLTGVAVASAPARRSCGTERVLPGTIGPPKPGSTTGPGIPYKIIVGAARSPALKRAACRRATGEGKGTWHEAPDISGIYTSLPAGWRCALATGGDYRCVRGRRIGASGYTDEIDGIQL